MARNYEDLSKEELIRLLQTRERRDATRFGLVWEANEIERDKALNSDFVALDLDKSLSCGDDSWRNLIIEGDNFDALRYLRMCFAGQVKCILIDPPYNTGEKDFIYNDNYVDKEHSWRHSLWIEFMFQRLQIARDLLTQDGVLLIHIGEDEVHRLGCLMDQIMPGRKVGTFVWRTRNGANDSKEYFRSIDHEYVICYANSDFVFGGRNKEMADYANPDNDPRGEWVSSDLSKAHNFRQREGTYYPLQNPTNGIWYPCNPDRVWAYATEKNLSKGEKLKGESIEQLIRENKILWPTETDPVYYPTKEDLFAAIEAGTAPKNLRKDLPDLDTWVGRKIGRNTPRRKKFKTDVKLLSRPLSSWIVPSADKEEVAELLSDDADSEHLQSKGTSEGTSLLRKILPDVEFPFPKPLELIRALLEQTTSGNDIILDFFAGSGTTGHAVLAQNAIDHDERRFILVSSTEATSIDPQKNICREVTRVRLDRVIKGFSYSTKNGTRKVDGLEGDFAYLRCRKIPAAKLLEVEHEQVWTALQLLHRSTLTEYKNASFLVAEEADDDSALIYIPRFQPKLIEKLRQKVKEYGAVVIYSWQPGLLRQHIRAKHVQHEAIPESLARRFGLKG